MEKLINIIKIIDGRYVLNTDLLNSALQLAENCDNIALISIVGPKSHGKTFFIKCLINYMCSEHKDKWPHSKDALIKMDLRPQSYGDNITPVVKLTSSPFIITDKIENEVIRTAVFLMDSDFVFDNEMSSQQVKDIIELFLLTSSTVIYNNMRFLPRREFLCLKQISSEISKIDNSLDSLKNIVFLIRDWSLSAEKRNNEWSSGLHDGSKYIKNCVEKMDLNERYEDLSCFLMSAPGLYNQTNVIKLFELNKQFVFDLKNLIDFKLLSIEEMQKKQRLNTNEYINANELLELFENCVKKLNRELNGGIKNLIIEEQLSDEIESSKNKTDLDMNASNSVFVNGFNQMSESHERDFQSKFGRDSKNSDIFEEKNVNGAEKLNSYGIDSMSLNHANESDSDESFTILEPFMTNDVSKKSYPRKKQNIKVIRIHEDTNDSSDQYMKDNNIETNEMTSEELSKKNNLMYNFIKSNKENERRFLCECQSSTNNCIVHKHLERNLEVRTGNGRYDKIFDELCCIAIGSYGIVFKAMDKRSNRIFAIKKIPIYELSEGKVHNEAYILSKLKSNFIVKFESVWIEDNYLEAGDFENVRNIRINSTQEVFNKNKSRLLNIQMEFCSITLKEAMINLNQKLNHGISKVMTLLGYYIASELFIEILEGIDYLHKQKVIHRDLKPNNILITDGKTGNFIKIADFGFATIHEFDGQSHTKYKGTDRYVAPEVLRTRKYDTKADIYSLGVVALDLFNIDINKPIGEGSKLVNKYSAIFNVIERMLSQKTVLRPYSESILNEKESWALSLNEIENDIPAKYKTEKYYKVLDLFFLNSILFSNE